MPLRKRNLPDSHLGDTVLKDGTTRLQTYQRTRCSCLRKWTFYGLLLWCSLMVAGYFLSPFHAIKCEISILELKGPLTSNYKLAQGTRIPNLPGPECVVEDENGNLYTGLADGRVVRIQPTKDGSFENAKVENLTDGKVTNPLPATTHKLGNARPSGLRLHGDNLFVVDCVYGLYSINIRNLSFSMLVQISDVFPVLKFPNDLDISSNGNFVYFTDVDDDYSVAQIMYGVLSGKCSGRLLEYNISSKKLRVVTSQLCGANGVQVSIDKKSVIVSEMYRNRVTWIDILTGKHIRSVQMPMMPDGLTKINNNNYWIAGSQVPNSFAKFLFGTPMLRQSLAGFVPHDVLAIFVFVCSFDFRHNIVVEINDQGKIIHSMYDPYGNLTYGLAHATQLHDGRIALASYIAHFIGIVDPNILNIN
uniref:Adipocyte plasma membrane-associated protein n=1 Tax=Phallusia mammillata TaxID=59560 RepID=A0A6F9D8U1_9ASCI|nr:adipocyte plasma membrane-associated protein [Phallusia mammillata]